MWMIPESATHVVAWDLIAAYTGDGVRGVLIRSGKVHALSSMRGNARVSVCLPWVDDHENVVTWILAVDVKAVRVHLQWTRPLAVSDVQVTCEALGRIRVAWRIGSYGSRHTFVASKSLNTLCRLAVSKASLSRLFVSAMWNVSPGLIRRVGPVSSPLKDRVNWRRSLGP